MRGDDVVYLTIETAAAKLACSTTAVRRVAKRDGLGIVADGHRLVAIAAHELPLIKPHLHEGRGNPVWIAAARAKPKPRPSYIVKSKRAK